MKQSPTFFVGPDGAHTAPADDDLRLARASSANVLLIGHDPEVSDAAAYLAGWASSPPLTMCTADGLRLPPEATRDVVVIARGVDALPPNQQQQLLHWLTLASGETRVISTASPSLWPMVREGAFSPELYYRLNTVCVHLS